MATAPEYIYYLKATNTFPYHSDEKLRVLAQLCFNHGAVLVDGECANFMLLKYPIGSDVHKFYNLLEYSVAYTIDGNTSAHMDYGQTIVVRVPPDASGKHWQPKEYDASAIAKTCIYEDMNAEIEIIEHDLGIK